MSDSAISMILARKINSRQDMSIDKLIAQGTQPHMYSVNTLMAINDILTYGANGMLSDVNIFKQLVLSDDFAYYLNSTKDKVKYVALLTLASNHGLWGEVVNRLLDTTIFTGVRTNREMNKEQIDWLLLGNGNPYKKLQVFIHAYPLVAVKYLSTNSSPYVSYFKNVVGTDKIKTVRLGYAEAKSRPFEIEKDGIVILHINHYYADFGITIDGVKVYENTSESRNTDVIYPFLGGLYSVEWSSSNTSYYDEITYYDATI